MKACHDLCFCSKKLHKVAIQWSEKDFQLSFWHCFHSPSQFSPFVGLFESRNSMRWKRLSAVILGFQSILKVAIQWKWKGLLIVILVCFQSKNKPILFADLFWKLQFNEMKSTLNCHFGFVFHKVVLSVPWRAKDFNWTFGCSLWKSIAPAVLGRFCTELACPCQLSCSLTSYWLWP